jgi:hypothetical protein
MVYYEYVAYDEFQSNVRRFKAADSPCGSVSRRSPAKPREVRQQQLGTLQAALMLQIPNSVEKLLLQIS